MMQIMPTIEKLESWVDENENQQVREIDTVPTLSGNMTKLLEEVDDHIQ